MQGFTEPDLSPIAAHQYRAGLFSECNRRRGGDVKLQSMRGRPLSEAQLARLLRPFEIYPTSFGNARGYRLAECQDAFARYVLTDEPAQTVRVSKPIVREALFQVSAGVKGNPS